MKKIIKIVLSILIGQFIGAFAFNQIVLQNDLISGGLGGLATVINNITGINIQILLAVLALPIIIWAFFKYDKKQVLFASICFIMFTVNISIVDAIFPAFKTDPIIAAITAGVLFGLATGLILRSGISNGPESIVGLFLKKKYGITVGNFFLILNTIIMLSSLIYGNLTMIIYSIIMSYVASKVTDQVILGISRNHIVNIVSDSYVEIAQFMKDELGKGVNFVQSLDTQNVRKRMIIKAVCTTRELIKVKDFIEKLNDDTFMYVNESSEVIGGGFIQ